MNQVPAPAATPTPPPAQQPPKKKTARIILGCLGGFLAFAAVIFGLAFVATQPMAKAAHAQLKAFRAGNLEEAYSYSSTEFKKAISFEEFKAFTDAYPILVGHASARFNNREVTTDWGALSGRLKSKEGSVVPIAYSMVKENKEWKVFKFELGTSDVLQKSVPLIKDLEVGLVDEEDRITISTTTFHSKATIGVEAVIHSAPTGTFVITELSGVTNPEKNIAVDFELDEGGKPIPFYASFDLTGKGNRLPPGDYILRIYMEDVSGVPLGRERTVPIKITP